MSRYDPPAGNEPGTDHPEGPDVSLLIRAAQRGSIHERAEALRALGGTGDESALPVVRAALSHWHPLLRTAAVGAAGDLQDEASLPLLIEQLQHPGLFQSRTPLAEALGKIGHPEALSALLSAAQGSEDEDDGLRPAACQAIRRIGRRGARYLCALLAEPQLGGLAAPFLVELGEHVAPRLEVLQAEETGRTAWRAAVILAVQGRSGIETLGSLVEALRKDPQREPRIMAARSLLRLAEETADPSLLVAVPVLQQRQMMPDANHDEVQACRATVTAIERASKASRQLPVPAAPSTGPDLLPRPAADFILPAASLPLPSREDL